jgi:hypothetical protein
MSETLAKKQFGILMGHQYGFCYLPYPSFVPVRYLPGVRPALLFFVPLCIPHLPVSRLLLLASG